MMRLLGSKYKKIGWLAGLLIFCAQLNAQTMLSKEQKLKSAYLLNFTRYISWPAMPKDEQQASFQLCLQGSSPLLHFMQELVTVSAVKGRSPKVQVVIMEEVPQCHLSYIQSELSEPLSALSGSVIVADSESVAQEIATITFYTEARRLRFEINLQTLQTSSFMISSELLKLARIKH